MNRIPRWRIVAAAAVLAALAFFAAMFAPIYLRNLQLGEFVSTLPRRVENQTKSGAPPSDGEVRSWVLEKARQLIKSTLAPEIVSGRSPRKTRSASSAVLVATSSALASFPPTTP